MIRPSTADTAHGVGRLRPAGVPTEIGDELIIDVGGGQTTTGRFGGWSTIRGFVVVARDRRDGAPVIEEVAKNRVWHAHGRPPLETLKRRPKCVGPRDAGQRVTPRDEVPAGEPPAATETNDE